MPQGRATPIVLNRCETFKLSPDPQFVEKVRDVGGLYLNPPDRALVLCLDEKTEIQALERTQPVLPLQPSQPEWRTSNYIRHGTSPVQAWPVGRPRYHLHFTPTSASRLNQVERFFAPLTARQLERGVHRSVDELEAAIQRYVEAYNAAPPRRDTGGRRGLWRPARFLRAPPHTWSRPYGARAPRPPPGPPAARTR